MEKSAVVKLGTIGKLMAGDDRYLLLRPSPDTSTSWLADIPGAKFYGVKMNEKTYEASKPQFISVGDGFHIDIYLEVQDVTLIVHWKGEQPQIVTDFALPVESQ